MLKAAVAVIAGFVAMGGIAVGLDQGFEHLFPGQYGPNGEVQSLSLLVFILAYTLFSCACGGWIAAAIARDNAMGATIALAVLIVFMSIVNMILIPNQLPLWWRIAGLTLTGPATILGGWRWTRRRAVSSRSPA